MAPTSNDHIASASPSSEDVHAALEKVLAAASFQSSPGLSRFLRFVVEHTLSGEADRLKEYRIGVDVLERPSSYDPRLDPVVRIHAHRLRAKLKEYYNHEGLGDAIRIDVPKGSYAAVFELTSGSKPFSAALDRQLDLAPRSRSETALPFRRRAWWYVGILLGIALLATATAIYWRHSRPLSVEASTPSVAVLPFLNLTGDPEKEWLSDGLTDEINGTLSTMSGLRVVARNSTFKFKGRPDDMRAIGKQLNVSLILAGSLQARGDRLEIAAQLIRASDGRRIWSETYQPQSENTFAVEGEITRDVATALRVRLLGQGQTHTPDPRAHELYLLGRYRWNRRTEPDEWKAVGYFNQALEQDPLYAQAYLGIAEAYSVLGINDQAPAGEVFPKARAAAQQALTLDSNLSEAHATLAQVTFFYTWDLPSAEQEFISALELNPNYATAHQWYGLLLMTERRFSEALQELKKAQDLDPLCLIVDVDLAQVYFFSGDRDAALRQVQRTLTYDANYPAAHDVLGFLFLQNHQYKEAEDEFQKYLVLSGNDPDALMEMGLVYAASGQRAKAQAILRELLTAKVGYSSPYNIASVYAALGDEEHAYQWLDVAIKQRSAACLLLPFDPAFDALRSQSRFQELLHRVIGQ